VLAAEFQLFCISAMPQQNNHMSELTNTGCADATEYSAMQIEINRPLHAPLLSYLTQASADALDIDAHPGTTP